MFVDAVLISLSFFVAFAVRGEFSAFTFTLKRMALVTPLLVVTRLFMNLVFEVYSRDGRSFRVQDVVTIFRALAIPSLILLLLRLFAPMPDLRVPISMILVEYLLTSAALVLFRTYRTGKKDWENGYRAYRALFISKYVNPKQIERIELHNPHWRIRYVLCKESLEHGLDIGNVRVIGWLDSVSQEQPIPSEPVDALWLDMSVSLSQRKDVQQLALRWALPVFMASTTTSVRPFSDFDLIEDCVKADAYVPDVVRDWSKTRSVLVVGCECEIFRNCLEPFLFENSRRLRSVGAFEEIRLQEDDLVIDLRRVVALEKGLCEPNWRQIGAAVETNLVVQFGNPWIPTDQTSDTAGSVLWFETLVGPGCSLGQASDEKGVSILQAGGYILKVAYLQSRMAPMEWCIASSGSQTAVAFALEYSSTEFTGLFSRQHPASQQTGLIL
jgi:hypothetical protein